MQLTSEFADAPNAVQTSRVGSEDFSQTWRDSAARTALAHAVPKAGTLAPHPGCNVSHLVPSTRVPKSGTLVLHPAPPTRELQAPPRPLPRPPPHLSHLPPPLGRTPFRGRREANLGLAPKHHVTKKLTNGARSSARRFGGLRVPVCPARGLWGGRCDGDWSGQKMPAGSLCCFRANKIEGEAREGSWTRPQERLVGKTRLPGAWA